MFLNPEPLSPTQTAVYQFLVMKILKPILSAAVIMAAFASANAQVLLTSGNYFQDFDTLNNTAGTTTATVLPTGWALTETGGGARDNEQYAVDTGASTTGDTYSYGSASSTDRAFGGLQSGTLIPVIGAQFQNNSGSAILGITVSYTGEEWRLGTASRTDQLNFQYSTDATSLATGTWTSVSALDFTTPATTTTGAKDGNAAANRTAIGPVFISGLSIAQSGTFWIRWNDLNATGADDGLAVDNFGLNFTNVPEPSTYALFAGLGLMGFGVWRRDRR